MKYESTFFLHAMIIILVLSIIHNKKLLDTQLNFCTCNFLWLHCLLPEFVIKGRDERGWSQIHEHSFSTYLIPIPLGKKITVVSYPQVIHNRLTVFFFSFWVLHRIWSTFSLSYSWLAFRFRRFSCMYIISEWGQDERRDLGQLCMTKKR